jgi:hypothetical protein
VSDCGCLPEAEELARLAKAARDGHRNIPYVGDGTPDTVIGCAHGDPVRLGDLAADEDAPARACGGTTAAGEPCKGRPGPDGFCAAHKPKDEAPDGPPVPPLAGTYPPA